MVSVPCCSFLAAVMQTPVICHPIILGAEHPCPNFFPSRGDMVCVSGEGMDPHGSAHTVEGLERGSC